MPYFSGGTSWMRREVRNQTARGRACLSFFLLSTKLVTMTRMRCGRSRHSIGNFSSHSTMHKQQCPTKCQNMKRLKQLHALSKRPAKISRPLQNGDDQGLLTPRSCAPHILRRENSVFQLYVKVVFVENMTVHFTDATRMRPTMEASVGQTPVKAKLPVTATAVTRSLPSTLTSWIPVFIEQFSGNIHGIQT